MNRCTACKTPLTVEEEKTWAVDADGRRIPCCSKLECMYWTLTAALLSVGCTTSWAERASLKLLEATLTRGIH